MTQSTPVSVPSPRPRFRASAVVVLVRGPVGETEVYWVRRSDLVSYMPGFHAFVGGGVNADDAAIAAAMIDNGDGGAASADGFDAGALRILEACAIRETFEETGVLLGAVSSGDHDLPNVRGRVLAGAAAFAAPEHGWHFRAGALRYIGRWTTPPFSIARHDSAFFMAEAPEGQEPSIIPGELASGEWILPSAALDLWQRGDAAFAAPVLQVLIELDHANRSNLSPFDDALIERLRTAPQRAGQPVRRIELKWGIVLHPTKTRPLPPATHTNTYLVGDREMALIDPGSDEPAELESLYAVIDALAVDGRTLAAILLTHHHSDHTAGYHAVRARYQVPVMAHALNHAARPDRTLADGDIVPLVSARRDWSLRAIATPGHTRDHLCFYHAGTRSLMTGDLIPGGSGTVIIDPPDGDMGEYLASLRGLLAEPIDALFPGHGSPQGAAHRRIRALIEHREAREAKVLAALADRPSTLQELVARVYADTPRDLWSYAERSLLAHLMHLESEGKAMRVGEGWRSAGA